MHVLLFVLVIFITSSGFAAGIEAIQLDHVPIDASLRCDRIFFKSTQHFKGTIYALPRIMTDTNEIKEDIVSLTKNPKNNAEKPYQLSFKVYFPGDDEEIKEKTAMDEAPSFKSCSFEAVKLYLNKTHPENPVHTIASMPLTSFDVSLPDFLTTAKRVGRNADDGDADIIDYLGKSFRITYEVSESEHKALLDAIQSGEGLQARVRFLFQARKRDGSLSIKIDTKKLAANFEASAKGSYGKIIKADIAAALQLALENTKLEINSQVSSSEEFNKISEKIIDKVLSEVDLAIKSESPSNSKPESAEEPNEGISIKAVANIIRTRVNQNIEYNNVKSAETASAETVIQLDANATDPNIHQLRIASGEGDASLTEPIYAGQTIKISPAYYMQIILRYKEKISYLTIEQMKSDSYSDIFQQKLSDGTWIFTTISPNGTPMAAAQRSFLAAPSEYNLVNYFWRRVEKHPVIVRNPRVTMGTSLDEFDRFPITVAFTNVGNQRRRFTFADLLQDSEYWKATYSATEGAITLTAKKDLGLLVLKQRFLLSKNKNNDALADDDEKNEPDWQRERIATETIVMERRNIYTSSIEDKDVKDVRVNSKATTRKRVVFFNISRPQNLQNNTEKEKENN